MAIHLISKASQGLSLTPPVLASFLPIVFHSFLSSLVDVILAFTSRALQTHLSARLRDNLSILGAVLPRSRLLPVLGTPACSGTWAELGFCIPCPPSHVLGYWDAQGPPQGRLQCCGAVPAAWP